MHTLSQNDRAARLDNSSLLPRNLGKRVTQDTHMIEANACDGNNVRVGSTRGVPAAAHTHLEHGNIDTLEGINRQGRHRKKVERRDGEDALPRRGASLVNASASLICSRNTLREQLVRDGSAINLHTLGVADELRRGIERTTQALAAKNRCGKAGRRGLAIGSRNLNAIKVCIRSLKLIEHLNDRLQQRTRIARDHAGIASERDSLLERKHGIGKRNRIHRAQDLSLTMNKKRASQASALSITQNVTF